MPMKKVDQSIKENKEEQAQVIAAVLFQTPKDNIF